MGVVEAPNVSPTDRVHHRADFGGARRCHQEVHVVRHEHVRVHPAAVVLARCAQGIAEEPVAGVRDEPESATRWKAGEQDCCLSFPKASLSSKR
jgi:hypothetical protein